ncbi:hypothetical protein [Microbacterium sp. LMI1-1-1.1]|uniref:hypothetical protein n=1 Tax=Microbacterium sp. LMI1-1-1.1 TaxID=3135223 RepID=UPI003466C438
MAETAPTVELIHVTTGPDGLTVTERLPAPEMTMRPVGQGIPPIWASDPQADVQSWSIWTLPPGWRGGWHRNPSRQWVMPISGRWWVETQDGVRTEMGPGEAHLGDDTNAVPDSTGRVGHDSGVIGDEPLVVMIVQLDDHSPA